MNTIKTLLDCTQPFPVPSNVRVVRFPNKDRYPVADHAAEDAERLAKVEAQRKSEERLRKLRVQAMIEGVVPLKTFLMLPTIDEGE